MSIFVLAIIHVLSVSISSKSARKSKSHKQAPVTFEEFLKYNNVNPHRIESLNEW